MSERTCTDWRFGPLHPAAIGVLLAAIVCPTVASESRIELRDGTVLYGEPISVSQGAYRIRSAVLGEIQVPESEVMVIRPFAAARDTGGAQDRGVAETEVASGATDYREGLAVIQQRLVADPGTMQAILGLQENPEIRAALADPDFTRLIMSGDLATLTADPRFRRIMADPAIQGVLGRLQPP